MEEKPIKQAINYIKKSKNILLVTHEKMDGDGLGSGLALIKILRKLDKKVSFISFDNVPDSLKFLPNSEVLSDKVPIGNDFIISLDCTNVSVNKLKYNKIGNRLNILINPKSGTFTEEDVTFRRGQSKYDLIIVLDCGDISQLGKLYRDNIDLFYDTVILNIDHHISNDHFGKINLVDPTATSTAEIVLSLIDSLQATIGKDITLLDEDVATCILTGITVDTNSFQNQNTSPKAFSISAQLLAAGARQQEIIKHIYKTHDLSTLRLWGKALSKLKYDKEAKIVWTILSMSDFEEVNASPDEINGLMDELITSAPGAEIALLIRQIGDSVYKGSIRTMSNAIDANRLAGFFKGGGHKRAAGFKIEGESVEKIENFVMKKLFDYQLNRAKNIPLNKGINMEENIVMKIPEDIETRTFVEKVREASEAHDNSKNHIKSRDITNMNKSDNNNKLENKSVPNTLTNEKQEIIKPKPEFNIDNKNLDDKKKEKEEIKKLENIVKIVKENKQSEDIPKVDIKENIENKNNDLPRNIDIKNNEINRENNISTEKINNIESKKQSLNQPTQHFSLERHVDNTENTLNQEKKKADNIDKVGHKDTPTTFSINRHSSNVTLDNDRNEDEKKNDNQKIEKEEKNSYKIELPSLNTNEANIDKNNINKNDGNIENIQPVYNVVNDSNDTTILNNDIINNDSVDSFEDKKQGSDNTTKDNNTNGNGFTPGIEFKLKDD